ncbi:hypothetical protein KVR01_013372 [Diaporthe batatas]|uniref:uncharacterized protein n=1 Tax=Diaporthe batatas TaxID=748121 RepID=UPI001D045E3C|nr:uncharacterized protein KVR01_013372 [Diaporthe batatas]KAG8156767.1 hypothetical protein KVR01_013372 [Diaporthe batatas]
MAEGDVQPLTESEINNFLDDLDHNKDGFIDYSEVEQKLDAVYDELVQGTPQAHHRLHRQHASSSSEHNTKQDHDRHAFLRSVIGSDKNKIPRADFAARVREWGIPSMQQDSEADESQKAYMRSLGIWRRLRSYWAVHGPEVAFLCLVVSLQIAFGVWQCVKYASTPEYQAAFGWGVVLAKTCAGALYPTFFFVVLSMSRYFSTFMRKWYYVSRFINWDLGQSFHIKMSCVALALATLHAIGHLSGTFNWGSRQSREEAVALLLGPDAVPRPYVRYVRSLPGWTGLTALGLFYLLALLSMPAVRKWNYEVFQLGHLLMFPIIGLMMAHGTAALLQWPMFGYWLAFPTLLVLVERVTRVAVGFHRIAATLTVLDSETVEVKATIPSERLWKYQAGQYVFLQVPELGNFQWHPFTVSICVGKEMRLHIKTDGNWTGRLRKLAGENGRADIKIGINGPFGAPAQRFYDFSHTIVNEKESLSGAAKADATPLQHQADSSQTTLANEKSKFADDYRRVDFHWMVRDRNHLLWLSDLLNEVSRSQKWHANHDSAQHLDIRISTHVTQKRKSISTHVYRWLLEMHRTPEHPESPLTGLINPSHFGRPDFTSILDAHYEEMLKYKAVLNEKDPRRWSDEEFKVGVFFCGTPIVGEMLADRCRLLSARGRNDSSKIEYHFMMEVFG